MQTVGICTQTFSGQEGATSRIKDERLDGANATNISKSTPILKASFEF